MKLRQTWFSVSRLRGCISLPFSWSETWVFFQNVKFVNMIFKCYPVRLYFKYKSFWVIVITNLAGAKITIIKCTFPSYRSACLSWLIGAAGELRASGEIKFQLCQQACSFYNSIKHAHSIIPLIFISMVALWLWSFGLELTKSSPHETIYLSILLQMQPVL